MLEIVHLLKFWSGDARMVRACVVYGRFGLARGWYVDRVKGGGGHKDYRPGVISICFLIFKKYHDVVVTFKLPFSFIVYAKLLSRLFHLDNMHMTSLHDHGDLLFYSKSDDSLQNKNVSSIFFDIFQMFLWSYNGENGAYRSLATNIPEKSNLQFWIWNYYNN